MKEKVLFIAAMIGTLSATIILLMNNILEMVGVEAGGYVDIINIVGTALALIILVVGIYFLNKYSTLQQKQTIAQNKTINTALGSNTELLNTLLPKLAGDILETAEKRGQALLKDTQTKVDQMMNEMLPALAEQTMQLVTEKSQSIVEETTAKANETMKKMDELIPTYAKNISDKVAQTVRENNLHYHKMLVELKALVAKLPQSTPATSLSQQLEDRLTKVDNLSDQLETKLTTLNQDINDKLETIALAISMSKEPEPIIVTTVGDTQPVEPIEEVIDEATKYVNAVDPEEVAIEVDSPNENEPIDFATVGYVEPTYSAEVIVPEESETQNEDNSQKSDETKTL